MEVDEDSEIDGEGPITSPSPKISSSPQLAELNLNKNGEAKLRRAWGKKSSATEV